MRRRTIVLGLILIMAVICLNDANGQKAEPASDSASGDVQPAKDAKVAPLFKTQMEAAQKVYRAAMEGMEGMEGMEVKQFGGLQVLVKGDQDVRPDLAYTWSVRWLNGADFEFIGIRSPTPV